MDARQRDRNVRMTYLGLYEDGTQITPPQSAALSQRRDEVAGTRPSPILKPS